MIRHRTLMQSWPAATQAVAILAITACCAGITALVHPKAPHWRTPATDGEVELSDVIAWPDHPIWVDARSTAQFEAAHVPNALPLNEDDWDTLLPGLIKQWAPGRWVVVYCDGGQCNAAQSVAARIRNELGIREVFVLRGGWGSWQRYADR